MDLPGYAVVIVLGAALFVVAIFSGSKEKGLRTVGSILLAVALVLVLALILAAVRGPAF